jgi:ribosome-associated protein
MEQDSRDIALFAAQVLDNKKGKDITVLGIHRVSLIADYFVIASGTSSIQVKALADEVSKKMEEIGKPLHHIEGYDEAKWVLLDYGDIVIHIFHQDTRQFYDLERLWSDAEKLKLDN